MPIRCRNRFLWPQGHAAPRRYAVLDGISPDYPPATGRSHTRYSPVRRSPAARIAPRPDAPRLACVRPVASVHPEPGSNSSLFVSFFYFFLCLDGNAFHLDPLAGVLCYRRIDRVAIMFNMTLLLYYFLSIVIISMSSLSRASREKRCKVTTFFSFPQTFCSKFCCRPSGASRPPPDDRFLKSECKVTPFTRNHQIFSSLF